jgi:hypothetical protein
MHVDRLARANLDHNYSQFRARLVRMPRVGDSQMHFMGRRHETLTPWSDYCNASAVNKPRWRTELEQGGRVY